MTEYTAPWFYSCGSIELLREAEQALRKTWVIPLELPWNMFTLAPVDADIERFKADDEKYACICPDDYDWFSVYDSATGVALYDDYSLCSSFELWAKDIDNRSIYGFQRYSSGIHGFCLIHAKCADKSDEMMYLYNALKLYNS